MAVQSGTPSVPTNQQVNSSGLPIVAKMPPPEGTMGAQLTYTLSPLAPAPVVSAAGSGDNGGAGATTVFYSNNIAAGSTIHLGMFIGVIGLNPASFTVADTQANAFAFAGFVTDGIGDNFAIFACVGCNAVTTADHITANYPANFELFVDVVAITNVSALDPNVTAGNFTANYTTGVPIAADELFVGIFNLTPSGWTAASGSQSQFTNVPKAAVAVSNGNAGGMNVGYIKGAASGSGPTQSQVITLKGQGGSGFPMSQICSLQIDNTQNDADVMVTHGAFNNTVNVVANSMAIIPTYSTAFSFSISLTASGDDFTEPITVPVTFLNYSTNYGAYVQPPPSPATVIPNPLPPTPTTQRSSAVGATTENLGFTVQADQNWNVTGTNNYNAAALNVPHTYTVDTIVLPALTSQGYVITMGMLTAAALTLHNATTPPTNVSSHVSLGYSNGGTDIGTWNTGNISTTPFTGTLAVLAQNYEIFVPDGDPLIMEFSVTWTDSGVGTTTVTGSINTQANGIVGAKST